MIDMIKKYYKILIIFIVLLVFILIFFLVNYYSNKYKNSIKKETINIKQDIKVETKKETKEKINYFYVDIKGAVKTPGVYKLEEGKRVDDAIKMAGGLIENSDTSIINLSKKIEDEMLIIIYTKEELQEYKNNLKIEEINKKLKEEIICPDYSNKACINIEEKKENDVSESNKISINKATKEELMTVSGIGESKAEEIIKYREENGEFKSIEDITSVSGIGESLYEKIKDYITV